ncbi:uncharacterized protein [Chironomus tepperi]|uniref:uncharacterized protein n=1 Tax=Chironomus tepperi TaxID=113505 RepID=UPI00391EE465
MKIFLITLLFFCDPVIKESTAFWSIGTENQFSYEIHDRSVMIKEVLNEIFIATNRPQTIQKDANTKAALSALAYLTTNLKQCVQMHDELMVASISRSSNENYYLNRISTYIGTCNKSLDILTNSTNQLNQLSAVTGLKIVQNLYKSLDLIQLKLNNASAASQSITQSISRLRNSSSLWTPSLLNDFIDLDTVNQMRNFLIITVNSYNDILMNINDAARLTFAYGSIYDIIQPSRYNGEKAANSSLLSFINTHNTYQNSILRNVDSNQVTIQNGFTSFIQSVLKSYNEDIVRPKFEKYQLPIIYDYLKIISAFVFNKQEMNMTLENRRNGIVDIFNKYVSNEPLLEFTEYIDVIMNLLQNPYLRYYGSDIDMLVSEAQNEITWFSSEYTFCLDERTASTKIVLPAVSSWLNDVKNAINSVLTELKNCLSSAMSIDARKSTSKCIQIQVNNMKNSFGYLNNLVANSLILSSARNIQLFNDCMNITDLSFTGSFNKTAKALLPVIVPS